MGCANWFHTAALILETTAAAFLQEKVLKLDLHLSGEAAGQSRCWHDWLISKANTGVRAHTHTQSNIHPLRSSTWLKFQLVSSVMQAESFTCLWLYYWQPIIAWWWEHINLNPSCHGNKEGLQTVGGQHSLFKGLVAGAWTAQSSRRYFSAKKG